MKKKSCSRTEKCSICNKPPLYFADVDTFGCLFCDQWTEEPHACHLKYGGCDGGFADAPKYPSEYKGQIKQPPNY